MTPKEQREAEYPSIIHITDWPKQNNLQPKTSSTIIYDRNHHLLHWGKDALNIIKFNQLKDDHRVIENYKHDLPTSIAQKDVIRPAGNTSMEQFINMRATIDLFRELFDHTVDGIMIQRPYDSSKIQKENIRFVITVPRGWNDIQRSIMRMVVKEGGLISEEDHESRLLIIDESVAAALYCEQNLHTSKINSNTEGKYMIFDAGGATTSITIYEVTRFGDHKVDDPLCRCQLTADIGKKCGSTHLDSKMNEVLLDICFGADKEAWKDNEYKKKELELLIAPLMDQFLVDKTNFGKAKKDFVPDCCRELYDLDDNDSECSDYGPNIIPVCEICDFVNGNDTQFVELDNFGDDTFFFITQGKILDQLKPQKNIDGVTITVDRNVCVIRLSYKFMRDMIFDEVINNALEFVRKQIKKANGKITRTYLVGGFGGSPYLQKRLLNEFPIDSPFYIGNLIMCNRGDIATMQGALSYGIDGGRIEPQTDVVVNSYQSPETFNYNTLICLDIGYSGTSCSYRDLRSRNDHMTEIVNWPGLDEANFMIPTAKTILNGNTLWGAQVRDTENRTPESFVTLSKLMSAMKGGFKLYLVELLKLVLGHVHSSIAKTNPDLSNKNNYRYVITMENCYQFFRNKSEMREIAQLAGIIKKDDSPKRLLLIRREDAAAMHFEETEYIGRKGPRNHFLQIGIYHDTCHLSLHESTKISGGDEEKYIKVEKDASQEIVSRFRNVRSMRSATFAFNFVEKLIAHLDSFVSTSACIICADPKSHSKYSTTYRTELKKSFLEYMKNDLDFSNNEIQTIIITKARCCKISITMYDLLEHIFLPAIRDLASKIHRFATQANMARLFNIDKVFLTGFLVKAKKEANDFLQKIIIKNISKVMNIRAELILPSKNNGKEALMGASHYGNYPEDFTERVSRRSYVVQVRGYKRQEFGKDVENTILELKKKKGRNMKNAIYNEEAYNAFIDKKKPVQLYYQSHIDSSIKNDDFIREPDDATLLIHRGDKISEYNQIHGFSKRFYSQEECIVYATVYYTIHPVLPECKVKVDLRRFIKLHQFEIYIKRDEDNPITVAPDSRLHFDISIIPGDNEVRFEAKIGTKLGNEIPVFRFRDEFLVANIYGDNDLFKSMNNLNQINYVIGIEFGSTTSGVSIAHVQDPFNIITVSSWKDTKRVSKKNPQNYSSQKFLSSILYPSDENDNILCGVEFEDVGNKGVYLANIGHYLVDIETSNEKLGQLMNGLTIKKVVIDYLKYFVPLVIQKLQKHDKLVKNEYFQNFVNEEFIYEEINTIRYCFVCPTNRQEFMKDCFIEAGIIEETEAEDRLSFVTEAVATAHYQLSLNRNVTMIQSNQDYLVCDVSNISIGIAKIVTASTESLSTVTGIFDDITQGSLNLEDRFKNYLIENMAELNLNILLIDQFVNAFIEDIKYTFDMFDPETPAISHVDANNNVVKFTYEDLNRIVFDPFIKNITNFISNVYKTHNQCKLILSGKYGADAYFAEKLANNHWEMSIYFHSIVEDSIKRISSGAVSSVVLGIYKSQIPFFSDKQTSGPENILEENSIIINENVVYDFIVAIDFGTTSSGCSYVKLRDNEGKRVTAEIIKTIKEDWPAGNALEFEKVPTLLMYDKNMKPKYWGEEARIQAKRHQDLSLLGNFKLFLGPDFLDADSLENFYGQYDNLEEKISYCAFNGYIEKKREFTAVKIIADYLKLFKNHIIEHIATKEMDDNFTHFTRARLLKKYKMRYVITVPAIWNTSGRDTMAQAAIEAGMITSSELDRLLIISEAEAAALSCEKKFSEYFNKAEDSINDTNFIVCDAGGGTVDLVTFNLQYNEEKKPMIVQIGDGISDTCGSTYLDVRFKNYIFEFYSSFGIDINRSNIQLDDVMQEFMKNHKSDFMPNFNNDSFYDINLPGKGIINAFSNPKYRLSNGNTTLKMKNQDMKEIIFDPVIERIFYLINDQLQQAEESGRKIDAILMVGGFSQSRYLQQCIKDQYKGVCHVSVPYEGVTATSHGAASYAFNPRMISRRTAVQSLALEVQAPFNKSLADLNERRVKGPDGDKIFEKDRLEYFVTRGQNFDGERQTVYTKDVHVVYPNASVIAIFSCESRDDADSRYITTNHAKIVEAKIIMPYVAGMDGKLIHFTVNLQIEHIGVTATIECQDPAINAEVRKITKNRKSSLKIKPQCSLNVASATHPLISYSLANTGYLYSIQRY
ncbi:hypothetical protein INT47_009542 [Mucor saturninus]|uniref:Uncharacterized protein n=1 Tax=Mucor saturninus TaxID=64648 RepID=A0A8H7R6E1_9FUNG|nr:hypothetical protein INT47_009542 [Mucor saturninus]